MTTTPVAELKAKLSKYLKQVKAGQEVLVTERGVPVAKLVPLEAAHKRGSRRERLASAGLLRLGRGRVRKALLTPPKGTVTGKTVLEALLEERREGR
ncbi:MAG: type II toxin-antitoxin system prevent-host-death family antitoxin [Planctomycetes bacterium]|nr:type II toxin-antitoxin system prevent-host-death family antitoxin [Planctomycetota bacterium]